MPRARPTRIPCDCFDCRTLEQPDRQQRSVPAWKASALQDPSPKCVIFLLPGEATMQGEAHKTDPPVPHLNNLAAEGCSGLLAVRMTSVSAEGQTLECQQVLTQFLGVHEPAADQAQQSLAVRYKDLAAGIASSDIANLSTAHKAAVTSVPAVCDCERMPHKELPDAATAADKILTVLGLKRCLSPKTAAFNALPSALFEDAAHAEEDDDLDMLIIDPGSTAERTGAFAWADAVVGHLCDAEDVKDSILMVLLMPADQPLCSPCRVTGASLPPGMRRPRQSYEFLGVQEVRSQRDSCVVTAQRLKGVVRCDNAKAFSYKECSQWGAAGGILLERLLPELAFKLGRSSKYGA